MKKRKTKKSIYETTKQERYELPIIELERLLTLGVLCTLPMEQIMMPGGSQTET